MSTSDPNEHRLQSPSNDSSESPTFTSIEAVATDNPKIYCRSPRLADHKSASYFLKEVIEERNSASEKQG
jgi:hypothetical protein